MTCLYRARGRHPESGCPRKNVINVALRKLTTARYSAYAMTKLAHGSLMTAMRKHTNHNLHAVWLTHPPLALEHTLSVVANYIPLPPA